MKSYLFLALRENDQLDHFVEAVQATAAGSDEDISFIVENALAVQAAKNSPETEKHLIKTRKRFSDDLTFLTNIGFFIGLILKSLKDDNSRENEKDYIFQDISEVVSAENKQLILTRCETIYASLEEKIETILSNDRIEAEVRGLFPYLNSISHTIEIRAVRAERKELHESSDRYTPKFTSFEPVASVLLGTDIGKKYIFNWTRAL